jgi:hypothetical protein
MAISTAHNVLAGIHGKLDRSMIVKRGAVISLPVRGQRKPPC